MKGRDQIEKELCTAIVSALQKDIEVIGRASLLVSGGSTPVKLFQILSFSEIEWKKVSIGLVDERILEKSNKNTNEYLVRKYLLQNNAKEANFIPLLTEGKDKQENLIEVRKQTEELLKPFSVVILGMGTDGHTASLFPDAAQLKAGMDLNSKEKLIIVEPQLAPFSRISFTRAELLKTKNLFLHCYGMEKKEILEQATKSKDQLKFPITGFIQQNQVQLQIFWAK